MGHHIAKARREALLLGVIEMALVAEKNHFVFRQGGLYRRDGRAGQVAREADIMNLRADTAGKRANIEIDGDGLRTLEVRTWKPLLGVVPSARY